METKSYLVIARKYRPQTFDDVVGQEPVATTLKNAIEFGRIGQAYLFTGPRGVGKTSMARIFAKALNCGKGPTVHPCGQCPACVEIEQSRALDVQEIDGASNRGIDEIRALRENVKFSPAAGKYKIYIIDEVHQITPDGFNALLKTLEEPPAHVKFIFATTSAQKVPATILSRCQRFDFRRLSGVQIAATLKSICAKEKINIDADALELIAQCADGSLRDAQSILDQMAAAAADRITAEAVIRSLGVLESQRLVALTDAIADKDAAAALRLLDQAMNEGKDPGLFLEKLLEHARNLLYLKVSGELADLLDASEKHKQELSRQKELFSKEELFYFFQVITHALVTMRRFEIKRLPLEMTVIKLAQMEPMQNLTQLLEALKAKTSTVAPSTGSPRPIAAAAEATRRPVQGSAGIDSSAAQVAASQSVVVKAPVQTPPQAQTSGIAAQASAVCENTTGSESVSVPAVAEEEEDLPEPMEELTEEIDAAEATWKKTSLTVESVWDALLAALRKEKISVATYLSEGRLMGMRDGTIRVVFAQALNFHKECLEVADNRKLIERHLAVLLRQEAHIEFETVKDDRLGAAPEPRASSKTQTESAGPAASAGQDMKSAMNIFGGRVVDDG